jgi:hypothetical protein
MFAEQLLLTLPPLLPEQETLQPPVPTVVGPVDYRVWRQRLERMDEILQQGRVEELFVRQCVQRRLARPEPLCDGDRLLLQRMAAMALRTTLARTLTGHSYRDFSARLADSPLLQWFCRLSRLGEVRIPSKSHLQRYQEMVEESGLREVVGTLLESAASAEGRLGLEHSVELETQFLDSTCVELHIHHPTDWVLLRDGVRTLMKATVLIRKRGLKTRMREPKAFLKQMNQLSIEMAKHTRRSSNRKARKKTLRAMKRLTRTAMAHAGRHRRLLAAQWKQTDLSQKQAARIGERMEVILERLPYALRQAHERIIGRRLVANEEKILSLYEGHAAVYVRGKAGAEVEFGSQLLLAEAESGLIADWELVCGNPEHDTTLLRRSLERRQPSPVKVVVGDRNFDSQASRELLRGRGIENAIAPRDASLLRSRFRDPRFVALQQRRAQTEARIAIFKNGFLRAPLLAKGHQAQARRVAWCVLTHNLWLLAGLPLQRPEKIPKAS